MMNPMFLRRLLQQRQGQVPEPMDMMDRTQDPMERGAASPLDEVVDPVRQAIMQQTVEPSAQQIPTMPNETSTVGDAVAVAQQPSAFDLYRKHISEAPQREDFKPSIGRRILAGLIGATGGLAGRSGGAQEVIEGPYNRATQDWRMRGEGLEDVAQIEDRQAGRSLSREREANMERNRTRDDERASAKLEADMAANQQKLEQGWARIATIQDETVRKTEADKLMNEHRRGLRDIMSRNAESSRIRATAYKARTDELNYGVLHPAAQTSIRKLALRELAQEPQFAPYWDSSRGQFGTEKMPVPPELVDQLYDAIENRERDIANRTRRDYRGAS